MERNPYNNHKECYADTHVFLQFLSTIKSIFNLLRSQLWILPHTMFVESWHYGDKTFTKCVFRHREMYKRYSMSGILCIIGTKVQYKYVQKGGNFKLFNTYCNKKVLNRITIIITLRQGWAQRSFPFFKRNVPFFSVLFSSFWQLYGRKYCFQM